MVICTETCPKSSVFLIIKEVRSTRNGCRYKIIRPFVMYLFQHGMTKKNPKIGVQIYYNMYILFRSLCLTTLISHVDGKSYLFFAVRKIQSNNYVNWMYITWMNECIWLRMIKKKQVQHRNAPEVVAAHPPCRCLTVLVLKDSTVPDLIVMDTIGTIFLKYKVISRGNSVYGRSLWVQYARATEFKYYKWASRTHRVMWSYINVC